MNLPRYSSNHPKNMEIDKKSNKDQKFIWTKHLEQLKGYFEENVKFQKLRRPAILLFWGVAIFSDIYFNFGLFANLFKRFEELGLPINIIGTAVLTAPVAFLIWSWRDQNKQNEIEVSKQTVHQNDFHQLEQWACDVREENHYLQRAALHQLRRYLSGKLGKEFRRPTIEIYLALLKSWRVSESGKPIRPEYVSTIQDIFSEDHEIWKEFDLKGIFLFLAVLRNLDLSRAKLANGEFFLSHLNKVDFSKADLLASNFSNAYLDDSTFEESNLSFTTFYRTKLKNVSFKNANFLGAKLYEVDLSEADFTGAKFLLTQISEDTILPQRIEIKEPLFKMVTKDQVQKDLEKKLKSSA